MQMEGKEKQSYDSVRSSQNKCEDDVVINNRSMSQTNIKKLFNNDPPRISNSRFLKKCQESEIKDEGNKKVFNRINLTLENKKNLLEEYRKLFKSKKTELINSSKAAL